MCWKKSDGGYTKGEYRSSRKEDILLDQLWQGTVYVCNEDRSYGFAWLWFAAFKLEVVSMSRDIEMMVLAVFFCRQLLNLERANQEDNQVGGQGVEEAEEYMPQVQLQ